MIPEFCASNHFFSVLGKGEQSQSNNKEQYIVQNIATEEVKWLRTAFVLGEVFPSSLQH
jgi:hypothetical protein